MNGKKDGYLRSIAPAILQYFACENGSGETVLRDFAGFSWASRLRAFSRYVHLSRLDKFKRK
jgi:hypothetical protein